MILNKNYTLGLILLFAAVLASIPGCGNGVTDREEFCMKNGGTAEFCMSGLRSTEFQQVRPAQTPGYGPIGEGTHQNYYGDPQYGSWSDGQYSFNEPYGPQASSTNAFLIGAGVGGLAAYVATKASNRSSWDAKNPSGYTAQSNETKGYFDKNGKPISATEYNRRKAQSAKDKASYKTKMQARERADKQKSDKYAADAAKRKAESDKARTASQGLSSDKAARAAKKQALLDKKAARLAKKAKDKRIADARKAAAKRKPPRR